MSAFKTSIVAAAASAALFASAAPASAAVVLTNIDSLDLNATDSGIFGADFDNAPGVFHHVFGFSLDAPRDTNAAVITFKLSSNDIDFSGITLDGFAFTQTGFDPSAEVWELASTLLTAGPHSITTDGTVFGSGKVSYSGTINIAAVPEPAVWAMMILGFGVIGGVMRRRQRQSVNYNFA